MLAIYLIQWSQNKWWVCVSYWLRHSGSKVQANWLYSEMYNSVQCIFCQFYRLPQAHYLYMIHWWHNLSKYLHHPYSTYSTSAPFLPNPNLQWTVGNQALTVNRERVGRKAGRGKEQGVWEKIYYLPNVWLWHIGFLYTWDNNSRMKQRLLPFAQHIIHDILLPSASPPPQVLQILFMKCSNQVRGLNVSGFHPLALSKWKCHPLY